MRSAYIPHALPRLAVRSPVRGVGEGSSPLLLRYTDRASMPAALPSVTSYLSRLPLGADSYPECMVKASLIHNAMASRPLGDDVPLPTAVRTLLAHLPPVSMWVPEVYFNILMLAILDVHFGTRDLIGYRDWVYTQNRKLFQTPLYRAVFLVVSPDRLLYGMEKRWESFRKGSMLRTRQQGPREVELHLTAPPSLYASVHVIGMSEALRAGIDAAGGKRSRVLGDLLSETEVCYRLMWE